MAPPSQWQDCTASGIASALIQVPTALAYKRRQVVLVVLITKAIKLQPSPQARKMAALAAEKSQVEAGGGPSESLDSDRQPGLSGLSDSESLRQRMPHCHCNGSGSLRA